MLLMYTLSFYFAEMFPLLEPCWATPNYKAMLLCTLSYCTAEMFPKRKLTDLYPASLHSWDIANLKTLLAILCHPKMLSSSTSYNIVEACLVLLRCWAIPNPKILPTYGLSHYIAQLFLTLEPCWCIPCLITVLRFSWYKKCCCLSCLITLLSYFQSWTFADVDNVFLLCWDVPSLGALLTYTLFWFIAELFPILKNCCCPPCLNIWLKGSQSWNFVDLYHVSLYCWAFPHLVTLLRQILSCYKFKLFPISEL